MKNKGLMISCKRATELIEISQEQKLAFKERMRLKLQISCVKYVIFMHNKAKNFQ